MDMANVLLLALRQSCENVNSLGQNSRTISKIFGLWGLSISTIGKNLEQDHHENGGTNMVPPTFALLLVSHFIVSWKSLGCLNEWQM
jgi:hypothetical protein